MRKILFRILSKSLNEDSRLEYFRKKVLEHLDKLEREEGKEKKEVKKSLLEAETMEKAGEGRGLPVGTVREWNEKKYVKIAPGKWKRKYDSADRGAKMAIAAIKRKAQNCKDGRELMQLILENRDRFSDANGHPLPFVQELSEYISSIDDKLAAETKKETPKTEETKVEDKAEKLEETKKIIESKDKKQIMKLLDSQPKINGGVYYVNRIAHNLITSYGIDSKEFDKFISYLEPYNRTEDNSHLYALKDGALKEIERLEKDGLAFKERNSKDSITFFKNGKFSKEGEEKYFITNPVSAPSEYFRQAFLNDEERNGKYLIHKDELGEFIQDHAKNKTYLPDKFKNNANVEESEAEKHQNRSDAMKGNKNAYKGKLSDDKVHHVKKMDYDVYEEYNTDKDVFAAHHKDGKFKGISMNQDIAGMIDKMDSGFDGKDKVVKEIHEKYPSVNESYVSQMLDYILMGVGKTRKPAPVYVHDNIGKDKESKDSKEDALAGKKSHYSKTLDDIKKKYTSGKSIEGDEDSITLPNGEEIEGKWKLVEADAPSASHDEKTFKKTDGFPANEDGSTINDRDYEHDVAAQESVTDIAGDYDSRALSMDSPVVVSKDGVVISGNNRTMSSKIAANNGTDKKYIEALKKKAKKFGFSAEDVEGFKNPRVVFETDVKGKYSTRQFADFNTTGQKSQSPVEKAIKIAKTIEPSTVENVAQKMSTYDTMGDLYTSTADCQDIFNSLVGSGIVQKNELPEYITDNGITSAGKEFLETVMIGSVLNETNIRQLSTEGGKALRQKLVRSLVPLIENKGFKGGYSINKEMNEAINIALIVSKNKEKYKDVESYGKEQDMFEKIDSVSLELAKKLEGLKEKDFASFMRDVNGGLRPNANGEIDIFLGGLESRDDVLSRFLSIKKALHEIFQEMMTA